MPGQFITLINGMGLWSLTWGQALMLVIASLVIYLAIRRGFEPLRLLPIGIGAFIVNLPLNGLLAAPVGPQAGGVFWYLSQGLGLQIFPSLMFLGIGAMTDFAPLLSNPRGFLLAAAAQFGVFAVLVAAAATGFNLHEAAAISLIGGADGPTAIFLAVKLAPHLLGPVILSLYVYMALVPVIQPPILHVLTTRKERSVVMEAPKPAARKMKLLFPLLVTAAGVLIVPRITPLLAMFMAGNLMRESGVVERLTRMAQNELINIVTFLLAICVGLTMTAEAVLRVQTLQILALGLAGFVLSTTGGVLLGKLMYLLSGGRVNPLIGSAAVSAVPMAARVAHNVAQEEQPQNQLLMHAMGPNVAGIIGTAFAAGILLAVLG